MKTLKNFLKRHKKAVLICCTVLITAVIVGILFTSTSLLGRVTNSNLFGSRDRNDDNMIDISSYEELDDTKFNGVEFTVDNEGVITLDGEAKADTTISLGTISISNDKPQYYFFSGAVGGDLDTYYMTIGSPELSQYCVINSVCCSGTQAIYFEPFGEEYSIDVSIVIKKGTELNEVKFYPVLSVDEPITYFE